MTNFEKYKQALTKTIYINATILNCDTCPCYPCKEPLPIGGGECEEQLQKWCNEDVDDDSIRRSDVISAIEEFAFWSFAFVPSDYEQLKERINCIPTAQPKCSHWVGEADGYADGALVFDIWSCGNCGTYFEEWEEEPKWKYCPECGARMK